MRAAYVCFDGGVPVFGWKGSAIHVQEVLRALVRAGVTIDLFTTRPEGTRPPDLERVRVHEIPLVRRGSRTDRERESMAADLQLMKALESAAPFDFIYERYSLWTAAAMEYAARCGISGILEVNAPLVDEQGLYRQLVNRTAAEELTARAFRAAAAVVAVSRSVAEHVTQVRGPYGVHVIPNGVDPDRFPPDLRPTFPASDPLTFTVGFIGSLKPWHGLGCLVDAFEILARRDGRVRLLVVGDGPERVSIEKTIMTRGLQHLVQFTGAVEPKMVPGLLVSMDAAVVPYPSGPAQYFSPLKLFECMAAGLPVVASAVGQAMDIIVDDVTGLLCEPGNVDGLAASLERLRNDIDLRQRLGGAARAHVATRYSWAGVARRILNLVATSTARLVEQAR